MKIHQDRWTADSGWTSQDTEPTEGAQLVLAFGPRESMECAELRTALETRFPGAHILGCSGAGEIEDTVVSDDDVVVTAVTFEHCRLSMAVTEIDDPASSEVCGARLAAQLPTEELGHVLVLSAGLGVNGSELIEGITGELPDSVSVTGGLSGDGARFERTFVIAGDRAGSNLVAAVGIHGSALRVGYGSLGGWDTFGPARIVTRSEGNVVHELDGTPALELYRRYLGDHAQDLPASGLLFPLAVELPGSDHPVVRTLLAVDEDAGTLTFAGDVPEGTTARLMKANFERLVDGAAQAATASMANPDVELALLISCVGRKLVLKQRVEEEVEAVRGVLGPRAALTGFYSYGEISPFTPSARCELHNQTMTVTTLGEAA